MDYSKTQSQCSNQVPNTERNCIVWRLSIKQIAGKQWLWISTNTELDLERHSIQHWDQLISTYT